MALCGHVRPFLPLIATYGLTWSYMAFLWSFLAVIDPNSFGLVWKWNLNSDLCVKKKIFRKITSIPCFYKHYENFPQKIDSILLLFFVHQITFANRCLIRAPFCYKNGLGWKILHVHDMTHCPSQVDIQRRTTFVIL